MAGPLTVVVLPAPSVTVTEVVTVPSASEDRSTVATVSFVAGAVTVVDPSENETTAVASSIPDTVNSTAVLSSALIVVSSIVSVGTANVVSRVMSAPLTVAVLPAPSVTVKEVVTVPSSSDDRLTVPSVANAVTVVDDPSVNETITSEAATSESTPDTVNSTAVLSSALIVVSSIVSVGTANVVSRVMSAPLTVAVLPASSVAVTEVNTVPSASE